MYLFVMAGEPELIMLVGFVYSFVNFYVLCLKNKIVHLKRFPL